MGKVCDHFAFLCAFFSFCASGIKFCMPGCLALLAGIYKCEASVCRSTCYCFFNNNTPSPRYAAIYVLQLCSKPVACSSYRPFKWPVTAGYWLCTVVQDLEQPFQATDLVPCIGCVPTHVHKALNFELWLSKKCTGGVGTQILFILHVDKTGREVR